MSFRIVIPESGGAGGEDVGIRRGEGEGEGQDPGVDFHAGDVIAGEMIHDEVAELVEEDARIPAILLSEKDQIGEVAGLGLEVHPLLLEPAKQIPDGGRQALRFGEASAGDGPVDGQAPGGRPAHLPLQALPAQAGQGVVDEKGSAQIFVLDRDIQNVRSGVQFDGFSLMEIRSLGRVGRPDSHALIILGVNTQDDAEGKGGGNAEGIGAVLACAGDIQPGAAARKGRSRGRHAGRSGSGSGQPRAGTGGGLRLVPQLHPHPPSRQRSVGERIPVVDPTGELQPSGRSGRRRRGGSGWRNRGGTLLRRLEVLRRDLRQTVIGAGAGALIASAEGGGAFP